MMSKQSHFIHMQSLHGYNVYHLAWISILCGLVGFAHQGGHSHMIIFLEVILYDFIQIFPGFDLETRLAINQCFWLWHGIEYMMV